MFTGIIEGLGTVKHIRSQGLGKTLTIEADFELDRSKVGDSIAVNGACLTAVSISGKRFEADVAPETLSRTTLERAKIGERVNLERALCFSDRLDGHLVSGHIDGVGSIKKRTNKGNAIIISIGAPESLTHYMILKGSVAVDGISLTINSWSQNSFDVSIIPHTAGLTSVGFKRIGEPVNIETDMIGKYVERFISINPAKNTGEPMDKGTSIDMEFLAKAGFIK
ncbi:MAG: riboflavin synthase [Desulfobacterales bacterium]|nr:riboflavin synthase [Desulfobacterales bacterium]